MSDILDPRFVEHMENDERINIENRANTREMKEDIRELKEGQKIIKDNHLAHMQVSINNIDKNHSVVLAELKTDMKIVMAGLGTIVAGMITYFFTQ